MSLQIWLPLNGNINNQGLNGDKFITNIDATISDGGKVGKCYSFNGSTAYLSGDPIFSNNNQIFSFSCWIKLNALPSSSGYYCLLCSRTSTASTGIAIWIKGDRTFYVDIGARWTTSSQTLEVGKWHHIAITSSTTGRALYVDGIKTDSTTSVHTAPTTVNTNCFLIGAQHSAAAGTANGTYLNGCLNDVRIYDHCLSDKEVHEISKALVLHFPFKNIGETNIHRNLLPDSNVNTNTKVRGSQNRYYENSSQSGYTATYTDIRNDAPINGILYGVKYTVTEVNGFHGVTWYSSGTISVTAIPHTLSCYIKILSGTDLQVKMQYGKSPYVTTTINLINDNEWHRYSWTFTPQTGSGKAAAGGTTRIYGAGLASVGEILVCGWKLEQGSYATDWCETGNLIEDCAGYGYYGTRCGTMTNPEANIRYDKVGHFSATSAKVVVTNFPTSGFADSYTIAWWGYLSANTPMHWGFGNGVRLNGMYQSKLWNTGDGSDNPIYKPGTTTQVIVPAASTWYHWVMVGDGTSCKVYKDGVLFGEAKTYKSIGGSCLFINGWDESTSYSSANYSISDFRVYATALSETDIKELYNTSASIDKNGVLYAREYVELEVEPEVTE